MLPMNDDTRNKHPRTWEELEIWRLRKERKAALRECGRLGMKLHMSRLEIESLHHQVKELDRLLDALRLHESEHYSLPPVPDGSWLEGNTDDQS